MTDILIKNGFIVTMDSKHRVFPNGNLYIDDGKIVSLGKSEDVQVPSEPEFVIDAKNKVVLPGFVNIHTHPEQYLRGAYNLIGDFFQVMLPLLEYDPPNGLADCAEMIYGGATTTCIEGSGNIEVLAEAAETAGNRVFLANTATEVNFKTLKEKGIYEYIPEIAKKGLEASINLYRKYHNTGDGRIKTFLHPHATDFVTPETYLQFKEIGEKYDLHINTNVAQSWREVRQVKKKYGKTPIEFLDDIGLLYDRVSCTHCTFISETDTLLLKNSGSQIHYCHPTVQSPFLKWLDIGIPVGLGTDDLHHSMLRLLKRLMLGTRYREQFIRGYYGMSMAASFQTSRRPTPFELLELATIKGAQVMGIDKEVGSLEPTKKADIITVNMLNPFLTPTTEPLASIVNYGTSADIDLVIVDGRIIKEKGVITTFDMDDALSKAQKRAESIWRQFFKDYPEQEARFKDRVPYLTELTS